MLPHCTVPGGRGTAAMARAPPPHWSVLPYVSRKTAGAPGKKSWPAEDAAPRTQPGLGGRKRKSVPYPKCSVKEASFGRKRDKPFSVLDERPADRRSFFLFCDVTTAETHHRFSRPSIYSAGLLCLISIPWTDPPATDIHLLCIA